MRDYGIVSPKFWVGQTGKALRGDMPAQLLALYLMTSPHASMIGVFHCPVLYMAHETGMTIEGASKALASLIEAGFCTFDEASEEVFVKRMAAFQVGEQLDAKDNRCKGIAKEAAKIQSPSVKAEFWAIYSTAFHLPIEAEKVSPFEAPTKPRTGTGAETRSETGSKVVARGSRLPTTFEPDFQFATDSGIRNATEEESKFRDYWNSQPGQKGVKTDWQATWRNWCRNSKTTAKPTAEPAWRTEQRNRTMEAVPSIAALNISPTEFFDVEAKNVTAITLGR